MADTIYESRWEMADTIYVFERVGESGWNPRTSIPGPSFEAAREKMEGILDPGSPPDRILLVRIRLDHMRAVFGAAEYEVRRGGVTLAAVA